MIKHCDLKTGMKIKNEYAGDIECKVLVITWDSVTIEDINNHRKYTYYMGKEDGYFNLYLIEPLTVKQNEPNNLIVPAEPDAINPSHYTSIPGIECIEVTEHFDFCTGNAIKYLWRWRDKEGIVDLQKAKWYIDRLIARVEVTG